MSAQLSLVPVSIPAGPPALGTDGPRRNQIWSPALSPRWLPRMCRHLSVSLTVSLLMLLWGSGSRRCLSVLSPSHHHGDPRGLGAGPSPTPRTPPSASAPAAAAGGHCSGHELPGPGGQCSGTTLRAGERSHLHPAVPSGEATSCPLRREWHFSAPWATITSACSALQGP